MYLLFFSALLLGVDRSCHVAYGHVMVRKEVFQVRCSEGEKAAWRALAESKHMSISEYTRAVLNAMVEKERNGG